MNATKASSPGTQANQGSQDTKANAVALLKADHRKVNALFRQAEAENSAEKKAQLVREICTELIVHTKLEEEIFYAACREASVESDLLDEAQVEHDGAKILIAELLQEQPDAPYYDAKVSVLSEYIKHHVGEEENPGSGIFAKARAAKLDMNALGQRLQSRKEELMQEIKDQGLSPPTLRALDVDPINRSKQENPTMARQYERERDEQGRFAGEDDDRRGGRGYYGRSNERERDEQGRFMSEDDDQQRYSSRGMSRGGERGWYGDSEGHSRASEEGWNNRDRGGGYASRSRDEEDNGYSRGSQGSSRGSGRGWYGDPEGHSRASEEGWENRGRGGGGYSSRSRDEEDGYSRSSQGSSRGGSQGSSRGGGGRGWYGDPEGHSRASEEGWENRGRGGGGYSTRSRDEEDDRDQRGSSGGRGHGGWFGDPRGHAEASRRGWQNR